MEYEAARALNGTPDFTCHQVCNQIGPLGVDLQRELFSSVLMVIKSIHLSDTIRKNRKFVNYLGKRVTSCLIFVTKWKKNFHYLSLSKIFCKLNVFSSILQLNSNKIMLFVHQPFSSLSSQSPICDHT